MDNRKLRKGILKAVLIITIINIISMYSWFSFKIEPIINMTITIKEKISEKELNDKYKNSKELLLDINNISNKYDIKFSVKDINEQELANYELKEKDLFLFSKIIKIDNSIYIVNAYLDQKVNTFNIVIELIFFQILVVTIFMVFIFLFARNKIIKPTEKIIESIRNYKFGKKPQKTEINTEFDLIQNEFVYLVDSLEKEKKEQNRIISSISHDIKTPLTSIIGYSNLINENDLTKQEIITYNKKINSKSLHIKKLLNTFDEYINNNNNQNLKINEITIKELITDLNNDYKIELENNNINFIIDTKLSKEIIKVDILKLKRIFSNMISNSVRYLKENDTIKISINKDQFNYIFIVSDTGPGVDESIIDKIFEPLFTTDESRKNSGLGLSICKEFISMHDGNIKAYNKQGLCIEFTLPINR
mgnify:CR=1 FL=1